MITLSWIILCFATLSFLAIRQYPTTKTLSYLVSALLIVTLFAPFSTLCLLVLWVAFGAAIFLNQNAEFRKDKLINPLLKRLQSHMPTMSDTERTALDAGTVWWEGELFKGAPNWDSWFQSPKPLLTAEEQAFLDGPVETVCQMTDDWQVTHELYDLPTEVWQYLKAQGFFGLTIPKEYGGLGFTPFGHSEITAKLASRSTVLSTTVTVPNSLGPAELLLNYGTEEQKNYYLPRLAAGIDIPAFALTSPDAGSDASKIPDTGIISYGDFQGQRVLGVRVNWNKRYITMAPIATVLGLAFQCYDPEHLLGNTSTLGITCALIPTNLAGIQIGRRHLPATLCFQNGPTQGKDVFIPLHYLIGGPNMVGQGWRMLMECLSCGRAISLPASASGGARLAALVSGAYCRIREQFGQSIVVFEGIQEALARIAYKTYISEATRSLTAFSVNCGEKPAVASAIAKCHVTELARQIAVDTMDIHGGKAVMMGPNNVLARGFQGVPVSITVEGANILTRSLIIFGQGAMRCHPYLYELFTAIQNKNLEKFDQLLWQQFAWTASMASKSLFFAITDGRFSSAPDQRIIQRYCQKLNRAASAFALISHLSLLILGGNLKFKESLSARLGDMLSMMYMASTCLKRFHDQGFPEDDLALLQPAMDHLLANFWKSMQDFLNNFALKPLNLLLKAWVMPFGNHYYQPSDGACRKAAFLLTESNVARRRLTKNTFVGQPETDYVAKLEYTLLMKSDLFHIEKKIKQAIKAQQINSLDKMEVYTQALQQSIITQQEFEQLVTYKEWHDQVIAVDDFSAEELTPFSKKNRRHTTNTTSCASTD